MSEGAWLAVAGLAWLATVLLSAGGWWRARTARRRVERGRQAAAGHHVSGLPGGYLLHHGTCGCGLGTWPILGRADWALLELYPVPERTP